MKGLIADANIQGQVEYLVQRMQAEPWADFWQALGLVLRRFVDVGLSESSTDFEVWNVCQSEQLILIIDNRNLDSEDSLEATIRRNNTPASLPIFTIADMREFRTDNSYVDAWSRHFSTTSCGSTTFAVRGGSISLETGLGSRTRPGDMVNGSQLAPSSHEAVVQHPPRVLSSRIPKHPKQLAMTPFTHLERRSSARSSTSNPRAFAPDFGTILIGYPTGLQRFTLGSHTCRTDEAELFGLIFKSCMQPESKPL